MVWLAVSLLSYLFGGVSTLINKFLLHRSISHPAVYTFYTSALGIFVLPLFPLAGLPPTARMFLVSVGAGAIFSAALLMFYSALQGGEVSRVAPWTGGLVPLFIVVLAHPILGETFRQSEWIAFFLIVVGGIFIGSEEEPAGGRARVGRPLSPFFLGALAAVLFAIAHVLAKFVYVNWGFLPGLIWRTLGSVVAAAILLAVPWSRGPIVKSLERPTAAKGRVQVLFLAGHAFGAVGFVLMNYAFTLGSVALTNALAGTQYVFIFLAVIVLSRGFPWILREKLDRSIILRKSLSIACIAAGIAVLFLTA